MPERSTTRPTAIRGDVLTFTGDPFADGLDATMRFERDAVLVMTDGVITAFGPAASIVVPTGVEVTHYEDALITAGFVDTHVHYPQLPIVGAHGAKLLDWLERFAFPAEQAFADRAHCARVAEAFLDESLRNGTTTNTVYCTVHPESVEEFFRASEARGMRNIAGKVLMDRNAPDGLRDGSAQQSYDESKALIDAWHGRGRQLYGVTPRFAPTSTEEQMELAGSLWREHPGTYLQSHLAETVGEITWVRELYPARRDYLDVYEYFGQVGPRAIFGHGIHLGESELHRLHDAGAAIAHCPTSNLFLGSGTFDLERAVQPGRPVRVGIATDVGGGTNLSMLRTLGEAYKVARMTGGYFSPCHALYLATRGGARALHLEDTIGSVADGMEADVTVLDLHATPLLEFRMGFCDTVEEQLGVLMMLGGDRVTRATYVAGQKVYERDPSAT